MVIAALLDTQPSDIWHDPIFQFGVNIAIAVLAVIISSFVAIWIYRRQKSKKEITYQIVSDAPVISINQTIEKRVEVKLDDCLVKEVTLAVIKVWNSGDTGIRKDEYDVPIGFEFEGRKVASHEVIATEPENLISDDVKKNLLISPTPNKVELTPILLNAKESVNFSVLLKGPMGKINKQGRIIDGTIVETDIKNQPLRITVSLLLSVILIFTLVISFFALSSLNNLINSFYLLLVVLIVVVGGISIIVLLTPDFLKKFKSGLLFVWI